MELYDISQYAPQALVVVCLVMMSGLSLPTYQRPNTWHMTLFIVAVFSLLNAFFMPLYEYFTSTETLRGMGGSLKDRSTEAYKAWTMGFAHIYAFSAALAILMCMLVRRFSQRGRGSIAVLMAAFGGVHVINALKVMSGIAVTSDGDFMFLPFFQWFDILTFVNYVYSNHSGLLFYLSVIQIAVLIIGASGGWHRDNVNRFFKGVLSFVSNTPRIARIRTLCALARYHGPDKRAQT